MRIVVILIFMCCLAQLKAQAPKRFYFRFGGNGYDYAYDVKQTLDNGYIITGSTSSMGFGNTDAYLIKLDSMGQRKFETTFGGYSNDIGKSVIQVADSGFVMLGYTGSFGAGGYDIYLIKTDKAGNISWQKTIGDTDWDFGYSMQETADGGFIICGSTYNSKYGNADGYVIKTDNGGNVLWRKYYGGKYNDEFKSVIQTTDGGYTLCGYTKSYNDTVNGDGWIMRLNASGDSTFSTSAGGTKEDVFNNVIQLSNTDLYFVGANKSHTGTNSVNWQYVLNTTNILTSNNFIGNTNNERYNSSCRGLNNCIVTVGYNNFMGTSSDGNIHLYTPSLGYMSYFPFGVEDMDELFAVAPTKDKGFVAVGTCKGNTSILNDFLFVKTDSLSNYGNSIIGVKEHQFHVSTTVFPNPAKDKINCIINYKNFDELTISLTDLNGQTVLKQRLSVSESIIDINFVAPGFYFLNYITNDQIVKTEKIAITR